MIIKFLWGVATLVVALILISIVLPKTELPNNTTQIEKHVKQLDEILVTPTVIIEPTPTPTVTPKPTVEPTIKPTVKPTATPTVKPTAKPTEKPQEAKRKISDADYELLVRLVYAEAGIDGMKSQIGVANVVLNRVKSTEFPNTIRGVIYEPSQFSVVSNGTINNQPKKENYEAVDRALSGENTVDDCTFFWAEWLDKDNEYLWNKGVRFHYDGTIFSGHIK